MPFAPQDFEYREVPWVFFGFPGFHGSQPLVENHRIWTVKYHSELWIVVIDSDLYY